MNEEQILNYIEDDDKLSHEWFIYQGTEDGTIFDFYAEFIRNDLDDRYLALTILFLAIFKLTKRIGVFFVSFTMVLSINFLVSNLFKEQSIFPPYKLG